jgi:dipeptidyl aminopeptidase/acylaminoacyl peptidase
MRLRLPPSLSTCALVASLAACAAAPVLAAPGRPIRFEEMAKIPRVGGVALSPDGRLAAYTVSTPDVAANTSRSAIWAVPTSGGEARRITSGDKRDSDARFSPDGRTLAFLSTRDGAPQIWTVPVAGGDASKATSVPTGVDAFTWAPDGGSFIASSTVFPECSDAACLQKELDRRANAKVRGRLADKVFIRHWDTWKDGTRSHILRVPVAGGPYVDLTPGNRDAPPFTVGGGVDWDVSPDGRELVYASNPDANEAISTNADVYVVAVNAGGGAAKDLTSANPAFDGTPRYSPDGKWIAYRSQRRAGFEADRFRLMVLDRATGLSRSLTDDLDAWAEDFRWMPDSKSLVFTTQLRGRDAFYRVSLSGGAPAPIWTGGGIASFELAGNRIVFVSSTISRAPEVWTVGLDGRGAAPLTHAADAVFSGLQPGEVSERTTPSSDGHSLHAWLVKPPGFDPSRRYPAVFLIHGGPQGAWIDSWSTRWNPQVWAAYGYVVYAANPRGSTGFGQDFLDAISGDWGGGVYDDLMRQADDLQSLPFVDGKRIAAAGASYGGYMIDWIAGHTDRFAALVSHDGTFDTVSANLETEELWFPNWEFKGWPWSSKLYEKWNPMLSSANMKTPMLVITSERDFRVPFGQGLQLFNTLQILGVPSRLLTFPDEGHWVLKPGNSSLWHNTVMDWLHRWIGGDPADPKALETAYSWTR